MSSNPSPLETPLPVDYLPCKAKASSFDDLRLLPLVYPTALVPEMQGYSPCELVSLSMAHLVRVESQGRQRIHSLTDTVPMSCTCWVEILTVVAPDLNDEGISLAFPGYDFALVVFGAWTLHHPSSNGYHEPGEAYNAHVEFPSPL